MCKRKSGLRCCPVGRLLPGKREHSTRKIVLTRPSIFGPCCSCCRGRRCAAPPAPVCTGRIRLCLVGCSILSWHFCTVSQPAEAGAAAVAASFSRCSAGRDRHTIMDSGLGFRSKLFLCTSWIVAFVVSRNLDVSSRQKLLNKK